MQSKTGKITIVRALPAHARGPATLPKVIKSGVNRLSHKRAALYEQAQRAAITAQLQRLAYQGAPPHVLLAALDQMEATDEK